MWAWEVVAEGVETDEQLRLLTDMHCEQVQGFLLGRPISAALTRDMLLTMREPLAA